MGARWIAGEHGRAPTSCGALELSRDGACASVESHRGSSGGEHGAVTVARAPWVLGFGPDVYVVEEHYLQTLAKLLGGEDLVLGAHDPFDERFVVRCKAGLEAARDALSLDTQRGLLSIDRDCVLTCEGRFVSLAWPGLEHDVRVLAHAITVVIEVARCGLAWLEPVAAARGVRSVPASGGISDWEPASFVFDHAPAAVTAAPVAREISRALRLQAKRVRPSEVAVRVAIEPDGHVDDDRMPSGLLPAEATTRLGELEGGLLAVTTDTVSIDLEGALTTARVEAAAYVVGSIAAGVEGSPFR